MAPAALPSPGPCAGVVESSVTMALKASGLRSMIALMAASRSSSRLPTG